MEFSGGGAGIGTFFGALLLSWLASWDLWRADRADRALAAAAALA